MYVGVGALNESSLTPFASSAEDYSSEGVRPLQA